MERCVWVFNSSKANVSGGVFEELDVAEQWIKKYHLTGILTKYPLNKGVLDWAIENNAINMKAEKLKEKVKDPDFIGGFTTASMEHYHYENGQRD